MAAGALSFVRERSGPGGKSGLPEDAVPGNARAEQSDGERHREQTAQATRSRAAGQW